MLKFFSRAPLKEVIFILLLQCSAPQGKRYIQYFGLSSYVLWKLSCEVTHDIPLPPRLPNNTVSKVMAALIVPSTLSRQVSARRMQGVGGVAFASEKCLGLETSISHQWNRLLASLYYQMAMEGGEWDVLSDK